MQSSIKISAREEHWKERFLILKNFAKKFRTLSLLKLAPGDHVLCTFWQKNLFQTPFLGMPQCGWNDENYADWVLQFLCLGSLHLGLSSWQCEEATIQCAFRSLHQKELVALEWNIKLKRFFKNIWDFCVPDQDYLLEGRFYSALWLGSPESGVSWKCFLWFS